MEYRSRIKIRYGNYLSLRPFEPKVVDGTQWILKGGVALEFRLRGRARATRGLDLAVTSGAADGLTVRELLIDALTEDPDGDCDS